MWNIRIIHPVLDSINYKIQHFQISDAAIMSGEMSPDTCIILSVN